MIYQVSYVIRGRKGAGKIAVVDHYLQPGEEVELAGERFTIIETEELIPPRSRFSYQHVVCEPIGS